MYITTQDRKTSVNGNEVTAFEVVGNDIRVSLDKDISKRYKGITFASYTTKDRCTVALNLFKKALFGNTDDEFKFPLDTDDGITYEERG